jgi:hypothetical protein
MSAMPATFNVNPWEKSAKDVGLKYACIGLHYLSLYIIYLDPYHQFVLLDLISKGRCLFFDHDVTGCRDKGDKRMPRIATPACSRALSGTQPLPPSPSPSLFLLECSINTKDLPFTFTRFPNPG